jgi:hypothetical protein
MGAWGCGSFENDYALDWVADLEDHEDLSFLSGTFDELLNAADGYPETPECSAAIAAAEFLAALGGRPSTHFPDDFEDWIAERKCPNADLFGKARKAIEVVSSNSELKDLWEEAGELQQWREVVKDLHSRLDE